MSCCKSIVYMVIHLGFFINVKLFYYVHKTTCTTSTIPIKASIEWRVSWTRCANLQFLFWNLHDMKCCLNMTRNGRNMWHKIKKERIEFAWTVLVGNRPTQRNDVAQIRPLPLSPLPHTTQYSLYRSQFRVFQQPTWTSATVLKLYILCVVQYHIQYSTR